MKKILIVALSCILFVGANAAFASDVKVGVVDVQQVLQNVPQVKALQTKLKKQFAPQEKKITVAQKQLQANIDKYKKNQAVMKAQDKDALQKKILDGQQQLRGMQVDFQKKVVAAQTLKILTQGTGETRLFAGTLAVCKHQAADFVTDVQGVDIRNRVKPRSFFYMNVPSFQLGVHRLYS